MTCTVYKLNCDPKVVDKTTFLASGSALSSFNPYEAIDDLHGYIITGTSKDEYDYVKITDISGKTRYYFVTSRELMTGERCKINLEEDVLMTFKDKILNTNCLITNSNAAGNSYVPQHYPTKAFKRIFEDCSPEISYDNSGSTYFTIVYCGGSVSNMGEVVETSGGAGDSIKQQMMQQ